MKKIVGLLIILILAFFLAKGWWSNQFAPVSEDKDTKVFVIAKGVGVSEIAKKLKEGNLIKSELAFKIYIRQNNLNNKL
ncbi:MAG: endolytic transglycosylase MltG, partial [Candidatus Daviesbacteria bacterium]|nr:endolytic transglycosylase MltG [Candidatus Daviesbacteria bacterium]